MIRCSRCLRSTEPPARLGLVGWGWAAGMADEAVAMEKVVTAETGTAVSRVEGTGAAVSKVEGAAAAMVNLVAVSRAAATVNVVAVSRVEEAAAAAAMVAAGMVNVVAVNRVEGAAAGMAGAAVGGLAASVAVEDPANELTAADSANELADTAAAGEDMAGGLGSSTSSTDDQYDNQSRRIRVHRYVCMR